MLRKKFWKKNVGKKILKNNFRKVMTNKFWKNKFQNKNIHYQTL